MLLEEYNIEPFLFFLEHLEIRLEKQQDSEQGRLLK